MRDVIEHLCALGYTREVLGEYIGAHVFGRTMEHNHMAIGHGFMKEPRFYEGTQSLSGVS